MNYFWCQGVRMSQNIKVLIINCPRGHGSVLFDTLEKSAYHFDRKCVDALEEFIQALDTESRDLIIYYFGIQGVDVYTALRVLKDKDLDIPFIMFLPDDEHEAFAIEAMKEGVTDYILGKHLHRLIPVIEREMKESQIRRQQRESERKLRLSSDKLQEVQMKYRAVLRSTPYGLCMLSPNWIIVWANRAMCNILYPSGDFHVTDGIVKTPFKILFKHEEGFSRYKKNAEEAVRMKGIHRTELLLQRLNGVPFWGEISVVRLNPLETAPGYVATVCDITERKSAEEESLRAHAIYSAAIENAQGVPYRLNYIQNKYDFVGKGCYNVLGIEADKLTPEIMKQLVRIIHMTDSNAPSDPLLYGKSFREGKVSRYRADIQIQTPAGEEKWISDCSVPIRDDRTHNVIRSLGILYDITERKKSEQELLKSRDRLKRMQLRHQAVLRSTPLGLCILNQDWKIVFANRAVRMMISPGSQVTQEIVGLPLQILFFSNQDFEKYIEEAKKKVSRQGIDIRELGLKRIGGTRFWCEVSVVALNPQDLSAGFVATLSDVSKQKEQREELSSSLEKVQRILRETVYSLAAAVEKRDPYTAGHQRRVANLSSTIAGAMGVTEDEIDSIYLASLVHDVGKINIPSEILSKPGRLSEVEFDMIKTHPEAGYEILKNIEFDSPIATVIRQHHERLDGSGYPYHISGNEILLHAKILAVADVVEAMSSHRPYRPALSSDEVFLELKNNKGILYEPEVVEAYMETKGQLLTRNI